MKQAYSNLGEKINANFYNIMLTVMAILNAMPVVAPILAYLGLALPAKAIYFVYSFFCHQLHWRSLHVCDYQYGWCSRCTALWLNVLLTGIMLKVFKMKPLKWYWLVVFMLPMALDGIVQTVATLLGFSSNGEIYYMSNNLVRMITGAFFGIGFGLWVWPTLIETSPVAIYKKKVRELKPWQIILLCLIISAIVLFIALLIWQATSPNYPPANLLDFSVKTPTLPQDFLIRSRNAL